MELRQLQYFVAVVEEAGFTRAAARLHLAQPGVSAQIRQLERELGQPLLDRSGRTVTTTEVGRAVLTHARAALAAVEEIRQTVDEFSGLLRGRVRVGLISGAGTRRFDLASLLADFHDAHPQVEISLTEETAERMLAALLGGALDIAVTGLADEQPPAGISYRLVIDDPLVAAVAPGDPLLTAHAGRTSVPLTALRERPLISLPRGTGLRGVLERACAQAGFRPRVAFEASVLPVLARLAARGLGVAVLPALPAHEASAAGLRTLEITGPRLRGRIALAWRTEGPAGPAARALLGRLRTALPEPESREEPPAPPRTGDARPAADGGPGHQAAGA
ncbi:DNA-binding transcriptional regulator, LysR family [Streptomyces sp. 2224.1]|uniref:LysR family transcriptional regulator n=1 Tax=unclassified Streptomyces TaxID=2593676 RepID=UPI00088C562E|nr:MULTISPECIES: LysR substrate-binding domain-containing protein [unclassified Streptomyces]PBC86823.1 DNA-binding transcriptional LysR family regulator [Streptomyces sp. 2321.6]SDQ71225.1 DNA-binding transcriptional regulator, LysR family [Streptomyces sp. KS_16]SED80774.1 DNA-binding transcriptional regulator, LysR family [Streptomyces sp. 2224.1]SEE10575.1 DNA-binding transcriptional regulator, LysR family [Streptomyces sp. 2133.1]SNC73999.1 DNA-binding transcriptional regulator, LysR fami